MGLQTPPKAGPPVKLIKLQPALHFLLKCVYGQQGSYSYGSSIMCKMVF